MTYLYVPLFLFFWQINITAARIFIWQVFFVDFGNTEKIPLDRLCRLPPEAMNIPAVVGIYFS